MPRISGTTNPTNLLEIAHKNISLEKIETHGTESLLVRKIDLAEYKLASTDFVFIIARAGNTSRRYSLGTVGKTILGPFDLSGLDKSSPLKFRLLIRNAESDRWLATAEGIKITGDGDIESILPIVSTDLGQLLWKLNLDEDSVLLQCNSRIFPNGASAESYPPFRALVLPEVLRQVLEHVCNDPQMLDVDDSIWSEWRDWMKGIGIEIPPPSKESEEQQANWIRESVGIFCMKFESANDLQRHLNMGEEL